MKTFPKPAKRATGASEEADRNVRPLAARCVPFLLVVDSQAVSRAKRGSATQPRALAISTLVRHTAWLVFIATLSGSAVSAQVDLTGLWRPLPRNEDGSGMDGDYTGLPLNAAGRARAQAWAPENFEVPEWVCRPHAWDFSLEAGASQLRINANIEDATQKLISLHGRLSMREQESDIWMDGRDRPPDYARHSWSGFSIGEWEGTRSSRQRRT